MNGAGILIGLLASLGLVVWFLMSIGRVNLDGGPARADPDPLAEDTPPAADEEIKPESERARNAQ
ncbi:hypothetical protein P1X14_10700 [Sphingomonas sp. AOB5]|uniref:hypothetical protein n=1 Tax=Sphingomonas sp. AOB5 TaxID=3034017 RepID=UPI0023F7704B|nr:hypothetical protein [Sphingomonas sp. AOB5]MDF7775716.1 hypothetical protein [Sphingomonas sp. AOB5]